MAEIVVLGAGLGGTLAAFELADQARAEDRVTLIGQGGSFQFTPSNPWVAVGWRNRPDVEVPLERVMQRRKIRLFTEGARTGPCGGEPGGTDRRGERGLRLPGDRHRPRSGVRRDPRLRAGGPHRLDLPDRPRRAGAHRVRGVLRRSRPDRGGRGAGRLLLRAGVRIRLYPRYRTAQAQAARPGADDLRDRRTLYRPSRPRRRRRHQVADGKRVPQPPHQMDHQRAGDRGGGRQGPGRGSGGRRVGGGDACAAVPVLHAAAGVPRRSRAARDRRGW